MVLKYGGIASDFDVIFLNGTEFWEQQERGACVLTTGELCCRMNAGFYSCMRNLTLRCQWRNSYVQDYREDWLYMTICAVVPVCLIEGHQHHYA